MKGPTCTVHNPCGGYTISQKVWRADVGSPINLRQGGRFRYNQDVSIAFSIARLARTLRIAVLATCSACASQSVAGGGTDPNTSASTGPSATPTSTASVDATPTPTSTGSSGSTGAPGPARISAFCPSGPFSAPLPQNPSVVTLNTSGPHFDHFDGAVWLPQLGKLYFSAWNNQPDTGIGPLSSIIAFTPPSTFDTISPSGNFGTNGLALDGNGCIVAAAHDREEIARFCAGNPNTRTSLASVYGGLHFNSPNDAAVRADGNIYFTDPDYQEDGRPGQGQGQTRVYRIAPNGSVSVVDGTRSEPNGIALSLDENGLFVGGNDNKVMRYPINADGSTGTGQPWIDLGNNGDGMVIDCAGNLYVSIYSENRVGVYNAVGQSIGSIPVGDNVTNLAFGDSDHMTLYITTISSVQSVRLLVPGLPH